MRKKILLAALLLTGCLFSMGAMGRVSAGVTVDGVDVGGLSYAEAERRVRICAPLQPAPLVIGTPAGDIDVSEELSCFDDLPRLLRRAKRGEDIRREPVRIWVDMEEKLMDVCRECAHEPVNAALYFGADGFEYSPEQAGFSCRYEQLKRDVSAALEGGGERVTLTGSVLSPEITEAQLRARTRELSRYSTNFDGSNAPRKHNLVLAAAHIIGSVIPPKGTFSFNEAVGKRNAANGYLSAPVILNGEFVPGIGGGVCQVSTTLFCAALQAGLTVLESHPHSLAVGYTQPSLDAMVSEASDLKLYNPYDTPVYLLGKVGKETLTFIVCGLPDGYTYRTESVVLERLAPPPPHVLQAGEDIPLRRAREGLRSESYLNKYDGAGRLVLRKRIRADRYAAVQGVVLPEEEPQNDEKN